MNGTSWNTIESKYKLKLITATGSKICALSAEVVKNPFAQLALFSECSLVIQAELYSATSQSSHL